MEFESMSITFSSEFTAPQAPMMHPGSRKLFRYWEALRAERPCPDRTEIDLRQLVDIIPHIVIIEMNSQFQEWQYRLAGTAVCELFGDSLTGLNALAGWDRFEKSAVAKSFGIAQARKQPCLVQMRIIRDAAQLISAELIVLPVFDAKLGQTQLLGGLFPLLNGKPFIPARAIRRELVSARMIWTEHETGNELVEQVGREARPFLRVIEGGRS
jgi:hypothetical protein